MDYFAEDGPTAIPRSATQQNNPAAEAAKSAYFKHFMVDFIEFNLRKVASQNTVFCAERCHVFTELIDQDLTAKQERSQLSCFEKCLGKHSDSLDVALSVLGQHLTALQATKVTTHTHEKGEATYLLSKSAFEPVYDKPK